MTVLTFSNLELAHLACALQTELKRLQDEMPDEFSDPDSYATALKTLHRRIHATVPQQIGLSQIKPAPPEVFIVQSKETGVCGAYWNHTAAQQHVDEMNRECPDDTYWWDVERVRED